MSFTLQDIVSYLRAPAGAMPTKKPGYYLFSEEENDLTEDLWIGSKVEAQEYVSTGVKSDTPAVCLMSSEEERFLYCLDVDNVLKCFRKVDGEWEEVTLEGADDDDNDDVVVVHQSSRLSGALVPGGQILFYEDEPGRLQSIRVEEETGRWTRLPPVVARLRPSAAHIAMSTSDSKLHLMYIYEDGSIHHLVKDGNDWHDEYMQGTTGFAGPNAIAEFMALPTVSATEHLSADKSKDCEPTICESLFDLFVLTQAEKLIRIDVEGQQTELGDVRSGNFAAKNSEQEIITLLKDIITGLERMMGFIRHKREKKKRQRQNRTGRK